MVRLRTIVAALGLGLALGAGCEGQNPVFLTAPRDAATAPGCGAEGQTCCLDAGAEGRCAAPLGCVDGAVCRACGADMQRCDGRCVAITDAAHCGGCGLRCPSEEGGRCLRVEGDRGPAVCDRPCAAGLTNCGPGSCTDPRTDPRHCGTCGHRCAEGESCESGLCVAACALTRCGAACVDLSAHVDHCGRCDARCGGDARCVGGRCVTGCDAPLRVCAGRCVDPAADPSHCGACGASCARPNAVTRCAEGQCVLERCQSGYGDCDGDPLNGCEVDLRTARTDCGRCGASCAAPRADVEAACVEGLCRLSTRCNAGTGDCDGVVTNGCETALDTINHCGACGRACRADNTFFACTAGRCEIADCVGGFADCDAQVETGCEAYLQVSQAHCGACGRPCDATQACVANQCVACGAPAQPQCQGTPCPRGGLLCNGQCLYGEVDPENCGSCGNRCPSGSACADRQCGTRCGQPEQPPCAGAMCAAGVPTVVPVAPGRTVTLCREAP